MNAFELFDALAFALERYPLIALLIALAGGVLSTST